MIAPSLITGPTEPPVSLAEAKAHLRVDFTDDDTLISALVDAATAHIDGHTGILARALVTQTWRQDFCDWPGDRVLRLPLAPVASVQSVKYFDAANAEITVDAIGNYALLEDARGPYIKFTSDFAAPALFDERDDRIGVTFVAGYGGAAEVPAAIRAAVLLIVGDLYKNRDAGEVAPNAAATALLTPYRRVWL